MVWSSVLGVAALAILVKAQSPISPTPFLTTTTTPASSPTRTPDVRAEASSTGSAAAETHTIAVGVSGYSFSPATTEAKVGDTIEWIFYPDAHSVIRAEFGFPCTPYEYVDIGREGFYSGPQPVKAITNNMPRYRVLVNDTDPIFFYCGAPGSCYKEKMIGVVNENSTHTLAGQLEAALPLTTQILPGEPFPVESDAPKPTNGSGGSNSSDGNGAVINNYHQGLSGGQIAGIVIGSLAFLLLGGILVFFCGRHGGLDRAYRRASIMTPAPLQPSQPPVTEINYVTQPKTPTNHDWRSSHYSSFSVGPYRDAALMGQFSPSMSPQPTGFSHPIGGMQTYFDPRISSIAPSSMVEAPDNQSTSPAAPAPLAVPRAAPVELPTSGDLGTSPLPEYDWRISFGEQESNYTSSKEA